MIRMLPNYYKYLYKKQDSFLAIIYGIFTIKMDRFSDFHVMLMQNTLPNINHTDVHYLFDLKGSSINRKVLKDKSGQNLEITCPTKGKVLKDLDYIRLKGIFKYFNTECEHTTKKIIEQLT